MPRLLVPTVKAVGRVGFKNLVIGSYLKFGPRIVIPLFYNLWGGISRDILGIF